MPATYHRVSRLVPSTQRTGVITDIETGDQIDITDVLGRPAHRIKIVPDDSADNITLRLNNRVKIPAYYGEGGMEKGHQKPETTTVVSRGAQHPAYVLTGESQYYTEDGLEVSFIDVEDNDGDGFTVYCW